MKNRFGAWYKVRWDGVIIDSDGEPLPNEEQFLYRKFWRQSHIISGLHLRKSYTTGQFHVIGHDHSLLDSLYHIAQHSGGRLVLNCPL